jgi:hypothetical protein
MYGMRQATPVAGRLEVHNPMTPMLTQTVVNPVMDNAVRYSEGREEREGERKG